MGSDTIDKDFDKACGIDVHRDLLVATILSRGGDKVQGTFSTGYESLLLLKEWIESNGCRNVAFESTGVYWRQLYRVLEPCCSVVVANPAKIKKPSKKKTDRVDSEWIAQLCLNDMIEPSRVFGGVLEQLRGLTRYRETIVVCIGQFKNRVHKLLSSCCINLSSVLSDVFGTNGRKILKLVLAGKSVDIILKSIKSKKVRDKEEQLRRALASCLDPVSVRTIRDCLGVIEDMESLLAQVDERIKLIVEPWAGELEVLQSIPGISFVSAVTILSEIGEVKDFLTPGNLVSWCGLAPSVYQSAGKLVTGRITKQGSKHVRRMLVQVSHVIARMDNKLSVFYERIAERRGKKKAIVALSRKLLCIIHHLLVNDEKYEEPGLKPKKVKPLKKVEEPVLELDKAIEIIAKAGKAVVDIASIKPPEKNARKPVTRPTR
jgi:transposase